VEKRERGGGICVYVCVCERERERERTTHIVCGGGDGGRETGRKGETQRVTIGSRAKIDRKTAGQWGNTR
jgi:hypothetical protein